MGTDHPRHFRRGTKELCEGAQELCEEAQDLTLWNRAFELV
jgi:hypothetical protein